MPILTMRQSQMAALADAAELCWLRKEIETLYPAECQTMTVQGVVRFVQESRARAKSFDFSSAELLSYLALELSFGEKFLDDPAQSWAREVLGKSTADTAAERMKRLRLAGIYRLAGMIEQDVRQQNVNLDAEEPLEITP